jgi:hypothetical protein
LLKIVLIIVNINKDENKSFISHQFSLKNDPPPHFLENYFAEVKIKDDHMIDKMEDRVKHASRNYSAILATLQITSYALGV